MTLEEAILHAEEVAQEQEDFENFKCEYCKLGCEDGVWKDTCRLPSNIPEGCSWGECSESNCPLFSNCLECASENRQLAEWLKELELYRETLIGRPCEVCKFHETGSCSRWGCVFEEVNADKGVLEKINEKQDSLRATCKAWDEAIEKDGYVD